MRYNMVEEVVDAGCGSSDKLCSNSEDDGNERAVVDVSSKPAHPQQFPSCATPVNPFTYYPHPSLTDFFFMALMIPILPFRLLLATLATVTAWSAAKLALYNNPSQIVNAAPFRGWRHVLREVILWCSRILFFSLGIQRIKVEGEVIFADSTIAPVVIAAPHCSYFDAFVSGLHSFTFVIKASAGRAPIVGTFLTALQPIFVNRDQAESRHSTREILVKRCSTEKGVWPSVFLFPEGTTGNGQALYKFKAGAFYPGEPVQMCTIEYRSFMSNWNPMVMAWDSNQPVWRTIFCAFLQPHVTAIVHILPVYYPTEEERADPNVFALNAQKRMAKHMRIAPTEYTYESVREFLRAKKLKTS